MDRINAYISKTEDFCISPMSLRDLATCKMFPLKIEEQESSEATRHASET